MTSRDRVMAAVNFREPDRVPIDLGGTRASGINAAVYDRMKRRMGISTPTEVHDPMQILAELEPEVLDRLGVDVVAARSRDGALGAAGREGGHPAASLRGRHGLLPAGDEHRGGAGRRLDAPAPRQHPLCAHAEGRPLLRLHPLDDGLPHRSQCLSPAHDGAGRGTAPPRSPRARPLRKHRQGHPRLGRGDHPPRHELAPRRQYHAGRPRRMALHAHGREADRERDDGALRGFLDRAAEALSPGRRRPRVRVGDRLGRRRHAARRPARAGTLRGNDRRRTIGASAPGFTRTRNGRPSSTPAARSIITSRTGSRPGWTS